ncbi:MAG: carbon storage regulator [Phycisphaerales bacterium]
MLVITRREGEEVVIGDPRNPIGVVRIASIRGDRVRVAFDFPRSVQVHRREVANQIAEEGDPPQIVASLRPKAPAGSEGSNGSMPGEAASGA